MGKPARKLREDIFDLLKSAGWDYRSVVVGVFRTMDKKRIIRIGIPGEGDIEGTNPYGLYYSIETKTPKDRKRREQQIAWAERVRKFGGVAIFAKSVEDVLDMIERYGAANPIQMRLENEKQEKNQREK